MGGLGIIKIAQNPVRAKLHSGQPTVGSWLTLCSPVAAENMAALLRGEIPEDCLNP